MKNMHKAPTAQIFKHQDIKQKEPPQKYRPGTTSNMEFTGGLKSILQVLNLTLSFCSGSQYLDSFSVLVVNI